MTAQVAVVVPMYNEEAGAERCVSALTAALRRLPCDATMVIVDDGSTDGTLARLQHMTPNVVGVNIVSKRANEGYGTALRAGAARAADIGAQWVIFMDSDLTNPPEHISRFIAAMNDDVDLIKACRYCSGGGVEGVPIWRWAISRTGSLVSRLLGGWQHRDPTNGFRAFRTSSYLALPLTETGFAVIMEELFLARRAGLRGTDVPSSLTCRSGKLRPSSFRYTPRQIWSYLRWPLRSTEDRLRSLKALWR